MKSAREAWFRENGPCKTCGSADNLELDHIDPKLKVSHAVWSWSQKRRDLELSKCQALCRRCHKLKTAEGRAEFRGRVVASLRKVSDKDVLRAVLLRQSGMTVRAIGKKMSVSHVTIVRLTNAAMAGKDFTHRGVMLGE